MPPPAPPDTGSGTVAPLGARGRRGLTVLWCSFLAAAVGTMVFFAFVDPAPIFAALVPTAALPDRTALYSVGFLFFWAICALASMLTAAMLATPAPHP